MKDTKKLKPLKGKAPKTRSLPAVAAMTRTSAGPMHNKALRGSGKGGKGARHPKHKGDRAEGNPTVRGWDLAEWGHDPDLLRLEVQGVHPSRVRAA